MSDPFKHTELRLVTPEYDSDLTEIVMKLQYLRRHTLGGSTPPPIFFQLKALFHMLESLNSTRIEGNRTTIAEAIEARIEPQSQESESLREIHNNEAAMRFIEEQIVGATRISKGFVRELHKMVVDGLSPPPNGEGDRTPGQFRKGNVSIARSTHQPPDIAVLQDYLDEFFVFINDPPDQKLDLLRIAIAHHRFAWIHPFNNGNGRVVRLITYALLISRGFDVRTGRILNPSAIFCSDRDHYYDMLGCADLGTDEAILTWCQYVLQGLFDELSKIDKLVDYDFLRDRILKPAIAHCRVSHIISEVESDILLIAVEKTIFQASDVATVLPTRHPSQRSRVLRHMREKRLIEPVKKNGRKYVIRFSNSLLTRGFIQALASEGFISLE